MMRIIRARIESITPAVSLSAVFSLRLVGLLSLFCLLAGVVCNAQTPKPSPQPTLRRPLPKLSNGARGFDSQKKPADASARLIAVGGGWGAGEEEKKPRLKSKTARGYYRLGEEYLERLEFDKAIGPLVKAVKLNPNYLAAYEALGKAYAYDGVARPDDMEDKAYLLKRYRQAIGAFEQARRLNVKDADLHLNLGVLYFNTGQYQKAVDSFREGLRFLSKPKDEDFNFISLRESATLTDIYQFMGEAYQLMGQRELAVSSYQQALKVGQDESKDQIYWELGQVYEELGQLDQALVNYQKYVASYNGEHIYIHGGEIFSNIGTIYAVQQKYREAAEAYGKSVDNQAYFLSSHLDNPSEADADAATKNKWEEKKYSLKTNLAQALYNVGVAQLNLNQTENAVKTFTLALEHLPDYAAARFNLGFAYHTLGDKKGAAEQVQLLKDIDSELAKELEELTNR